MTRLQLLHHEEQMEAYRHEWETAWVPNRLRLKQQGKTDREIAMMEFRSWRIWLEWMEEKQKQQAT